MLAYELLTGQPPFTGRTPAHLLAAHVNEAPESISRRRASLPPALAALVMRCLEKRPADRLQSAGEIVHALDDLSTPSGGMQPTSAARAAAGSAAGAVVGSRPKFSIGRAVGVAGILVALGVIGWVAVRGGRTSGGDATVLKTIAVLPFSSGGDTASDYFAEGITDELHSELARAQGLTVKARSVRTQFKDHSDDLAAVATRLGIGTLVVGSVRRAGSRVRITAELMRVSDNSTLWSQKFDGEEQNLFLLQDSVARAIAGALQGRLAEAKGARAGLAGNRNVAAYELYLRGKFFFYNRDESSIRRAIALFQQAIASDPTFARAYASLGDALLLLPDWSNTSVDSVLTPARAAIERAIALDSTLAEAHAARGSALMFSWPPRWDEAEHSLRRAIEIDPRDARAHLMLGVWYSQVGRIEEAIAEHRRATELDPHYANAWNNLGISYMTARRFDEAIASFRHALTVDEGLPGVQQSVAITLVLQGKPEAALRELASLPDSGTVAGDSAMRGFVYGRAGQRARAESIVRDLEQRSRSSSKHAGLVAYVYLGLGDSTRALEWFIRAADARESSFITYLASLEIDPIRSLPRYPELLRKLNLQDRPVAKLKAAGR